MSKIFGICLQDLHFGINSNGISSFNLINELEHGGFKSLANKTKKHLDFISINGDLFDRKINLNETSSKLVIKFINDLSDFCLDNKIKLILLKGTKTHDNDQMDNFKYLELTNPYFNVYNTFEIINIKDNRVLILPEEYMNNEDEYYKELKEILREDPVDMILGHGTFDVLAFKNQITESERYIKGSPVFTFKEWKDYCKGPILFGHIHVRQNHNNKLFYGGSYTRWCYGEEENKGFMLVKVDTDNDDYDVKFVDNKMATEFNTIYLSDITNEEQSIEEKIEILKEYQKNKKVNTRIKIDIDLKQENLEILKESMSTDMNIRLEMNANKVKDQIDEKSNSEYKFLSTDETLENNLIKYIKKEHGLLYKEDQIRDIIFGID